MTTKDSTKDAGKLKVSAGILVYCRQDSVLKVLLAHPGGPFWKNKDEGSWTIPKGEPDAGESLAAAAVREFSEETGWHLPSAMLKPLTPVKQKAGKWIHAWSVEDFRASEELFSNRFEIEWPPRSGRTQTFPEIDRFAWFDVETAMEKINPGQRSLLEELEKSFSNP